MSEEGVPAWRDAPPWLMEEMVASEPALIRAMAGRRESAERLAVRLCAAVTQGDPIVVTWCGASENAALAFGGRCHHRGPRRLVTDRTRRGQRDTG